MRHITIVLLSVLVLSGCSISHKSKYIIHTVGGMPDVYCDSYVVHDGVVEGEDDEGQHFVVSGYYVIEERK